MEAVQPVAEAGQDQLAGQLRMVEGDLEGHRRPRAVAEQVGRADAQVAQEGGGVVGPVADAQGPVDVGGVAVGLLLDRDDLAVPGQAGEDPAEVDPDGGQVAVEQDQRPPAAAVDLVVHLEPVDRGVAGLGHGDVPSFSSSGCWNSRSSQACQAASASLSSTSSAYRWWPTPTDPSKPQTNR